MIVVMILMVGVDVSSTSHRLSLCMHYACNSAKQSKEPSEQRREGDNDQTDQKEETPKPEKKKLKGLGANPGHKQSQNLLAKFVLFRLHAGQREKL